MSALALPSTSPSLLARLIKEALDRQRALTLYGLVLFALALPLLVLQLSDPRQLDGVNVWVKPVKFLVSVGVFSLTAAWFFGYVRPERRQALAMRATAWTLIAMGSLEIAWISWQAGHGLASHFNTTTPFFATMYALMGIWAVILVGTTLPLAWEIARHPVDGLRPDFVAAVVVGLLITFLLGGGLGGYMSSQAGHSVGAGGGHVPLFGWNRSGGDLRIAHFMGIHAEQAIPVLLALVGGLGSRLRWTILAVGTAAYVAVTFAVFAQAVGGRALFPL